MDMDELKLDILKELNEEQMDAVINYSGPIFLVAGPGSGKTRVVVDRTKYMILDGVNPSNILLFTFTNKAAREIKERISLSLGDETASLITMGTYHSFCCRLLRQYSTKIGYKKEFTIFDTEDSKKVLGKILSGTDIAPRDLIPYISGQKRKLISPQRALENAVANNDAYATYYEQYQTELYNQEAMDFDDLIYNTIKLLQGNPDVLAKVNTKYTYISADESHDSSMSDLTLIRLLAGERQNVCFILDEDQSIYSFRGADIEAVLAAQTMYKDLNIMYLNRNYRCTSTIVEASKSVIAHNTGRLGKKIFAHNQGGDKIIILEEKNAQMEAIRIARTIQLLTTKYGHKYEDIALLYRTNQLSRQLEEIFLRFKIPYEIISGVNFYQRKEIKDLVAYIQFLVNPYNVEAFTRIVNVPRRGVGKASIEKIIDIAREDLEPKSLLTACQEALDRKVIKGKARAGLDRFVEAIELVGHLQESVTVPELIREVIKQVNYYTYLEVEYEDGYEERALNVAELIELSYDAETLEQFLETTTLSSNMDLSEEDNNRVKLMTLHMSKGLEYPVVFLVGCNEGTLPFFRATSKEAIEEERRLFYVGMTRAKKRLFITRPKLVQLNGYMTSPQMTRYVSEIDESCVFKNK